MTFRGPGSGFAPVGVIFQAKDFDVFADRLGQADRLLQSLNSRISRTVDNFNGLGRSASSSSGFGNLTRTAQQGFRGFNNAAQGAVRQAFFFQSAARQAANTVRDLGQVILSPVSAARDFESAFASVTKTVDGLSQPVQGQNLFSSLTADGEALRQELINVSNRIPVSFEELSELAGVGGQFGLVEGIEDAEDRIQTLATFAETVAGLGEATNLSAENAARFLSRISAIYASDVPNMAENVEALGTALVLLGNTTPTTEAEIGQLALRVAGVGNTVGATQDQVLGLAAAFSGVGVRAEAGGTAISNVLLAIQQAGSLEGGLINNDAAIEKTQEKLQDLFADLVRLEAQTGLSGRAFADSLQGLSGEELGRVLGDRNRERLLNTQTEIDNLTQTLATLEAQQGRAIPNEVLQEYLTLVNRAADQTDEFGRLSVEQFQELARDNPVEILTRVVEGLGDSEEEAAASLAILGFNSVRTRDALLRVAGAGDLLREKLGQAKDEFDNVGEGVSENNAFNRELANRYSTLESRQETFNNQIRNAASALGFDFLPVADRFLTIIGDRIPDAIAAASTAFGPLATSVAQAINAFVTDEGDTGLGARLDSIFKSIAEFDVTPIQTGFTVLGNIFDFVSENFERISNFLLGGTGLIAGLALLGTTVAAITSPVTALFALGGTAFVAWQENFLGIQDRVLAIVQAISEGFGQLRASFEAGTFDPILETISRIVETISGISSENFQTFDQIFTGLITGGIDIFFDSLNKGLTDLAENWTTFETTITLGLAIVQTSFTNANEFIKNLPNPITAWLSGGADSGEADSGGIGRSINQALIAGLDEQATTIEDRIKNFVSIFDKALALPEEDEQSPAQQFIDGFLDPFRTIDLPEIDLSPITEAFTQLGDSDALARFAAQFDSITISLERLNNSTGDGTLLRTLGEALGELITIRIESYARDINLLAEGIGAAGQFASTYAENIGQFFSAFIETPVDQLTGIITALQGFGELVSVTTLGELGTALGNIANGLILVSSAPIVNFAEVFLGTEIEPPKLNFASWGVQITKATEAIQEALLGTSFEIDISKIKIFDTDLISRIGEDFREGIGNPISQIRDDLSGITVVDTELSQQITQLFRGSIGNAIAEIRTDFENLFSDIEFTAPDLSPILDVFKAMAEKVKEFFSPKNLFGGLETIVDADLSSVSGIADFFKDLFSEGEDSGKSAGEGFESGVDLYLPVIADKGRETGEAWEGALKEYLGIQSPSTLAQQIGADVVAGFVLGLQDITAILEALQTINTAVLEAFNQIGTQVTTVLGPGLLLVNEQFTLTNTNLTLLNERTLVYTPILRDMTAAFGELGVTVQTIVNPALAQLNNVQTLAYDSARRLRRAVRDLAKSYKTLASALQDVKRAGGSTAGIPQQAGVAAPGQGAPAFAKGGSFIVPGGQNSPYPIVVHGGELVQIFDRTTTQRMIQAPTESFPPRSGVREPSFSGAGITNAVNQTFNNQQDKSNTNYNLYVTQPLTQDVVGSFDMLRSITRSRNH